MLGQQQTANAARKILTHPAEANCSSAFLFFQLSELPGQSQDHLQGLTVNFLV